ncbi:unnamed protein product [Albugo candida]|uniref:Uncharacterized protein n=1 Tax=Albugo candida TaxID=65357 RepID=A0A024GMG0_9STRA|nr:unnamed protein product [Albugo candida]|eukprot:CCI47943.1 unnamed protein product [Albugo candida]
MLPNRRVQKGDYIHFAFPASVAQSFVCVCLRFWDEPPVSVHLEYFASLNLELDGDEMHVSIMTEKRCEDEAEANIRLNTLSKFILDKLARAFRESGFDGSALDARPRADDTDLPPFMFQSCAVYQVLVTPLQQEIKDGDFRAEMH